jgi:hypothetical protein
MPGTTTSILFVPIGSIRSRETRSAAGGCSRRPSQSMVVILSGTGRLISYLVLSTARPVSLRSTFPKEQMMVPGGRLNRRMTRRLSNPRKRRGLAGKRRPKAIGTTIEITNGTNNIDIYGQGCFLIFSADVDAFLQYEPELMSP